MSRVRTTEPIVGYYIDASGHRVDITVPEGSIGTVGGQGEFVNTRNVVLVLENRDVILPNLAPRQYQEI